MVIMSRTFHALLRGGLGAILVAGAAMAACGHASSSAPAVHPLGESTAPLPTNSAAPTIDAPGVPDPSAPTPPAAPPSGAWGQAARVDIAMADELAVDAGVPRDPREPHDPGPGPGSGSNLPRPTNPPNAPRPTNPGNGSGSGGNPLPAPGGPGVPPKAPSPTPPVPGPGTPPSTPTPGPR